RRRRLSAGAAPGSLGRAGPAHRRRVHRGRRRPGAARARRPGRVVAPAAAHRRTPPATASGYRGFAEDPAVTVVKLAIFELRKFQDKTSRLMPVVLCLVPLLYGAIYL